MRLPSEHGNTEWDGLFKRSCLCCRLWGRKCADAYWGENHLHLRVNYQVLKRNRFKHASLTQAQCVYCFSPPSSCMRVLSFGCKWIMNSVIFYFKRHNTTPVVNQQHRILELIEKYHRKPLFSIFMVAALCEKASAAMLTCEAMWRMNSVGW